MNRDKLISIMTEIREKREGLMIQKGDDYATEDILSNFKRMSTLCGILDINPSRNSSGCALFLLLLKIDRWCNLRRRGVEPKNESIKDTIIDAHNYIDLAYACQLGEKLDS